MPVLLTSCFICITVYNTSRTEITSLYRKELHMVIELDFASDTPIYVQLRNQMLKESARENLRLARNYRLSDSLLLTQALIQ